MEENRQPALADLNESSKWRRLAKRKYTQWAAGAAALLATIVLWWPHQTQNADHVPRAHRSPPDLTSIPSGLPQGGDWRGAIAFPKLQFHQPIRVHSVSFSNDLYVFEKDGLIVRVEGYGEGAQRSTFLDLRERTLPDNRGPADIAFHPNFGQPNLVGSSDVYVFYKRRSGHDVLSRFTSVDGCSADSDSEIVLIEQLSSQTHAGGALVFGGDGFLYVSSGEERQADQKVDVSLLGGVLRIDVDRRGGRISHAPRRQPVDGRTQNYFVPSDNPFVGRTDTLEEFWALGLRNPYTMSRDVESEDIWLADVGRNTWEEINLLRKGANYEWPYREGRAATDSADRPSPADYVGREVGPLYSYEQSEGNNSIIGGFVYRGAKWPKLTGRYIFGDNGSSRIWTITTDQSPPQVETLCQLPAYRFEGVTGFGTNADGDIFVSLLGNSRFDRPGQILELVPNVSWPAERLQLTDAEDESDDGRSSLSANQVSYSADSHTSNSSMRLSDTQLFADLKSLAPAPGVIPYVVNTPLWSDGAAKFRWIALPGDGTADDQDSDRIIVSGDFPHEFTFPEGTVFVKHFEVNTDENQPEQMRRLETRILRLNKDGFDGMVYQWNDSQTEAYLVRDRVSFEFDVHTSSGGVRPELWTIPNSSDCQMCHNEAAGYVLGVNVPQLNRKVMDPITGDSYNQLREWNKCGMLSGSTLRPEPISEQELSGWPRMVSINDHSASAEDRTLSYLAANCSHCHRKNIPGRPPRPIFDLRYHIPLQQRGLVGKSTVVVPGSLAKSRLYSRLTAEDLHRMPPIGRNLVDHVAADVISKWIKSLD